MTCFIDRAFERDGGRMMRDSYQRRNYSHYFRTGCDYYLNERTVWEVSLGDFFPAKENAGMFTEIRRNRSCREILTAMRTKPGIMFHRNSMVHKLKREGENSALLLIISITTVFETS